MSQKGKLQREVWKELKDVRNRGIGRLDELRPGLKEVSTQLLETAAKTVPGYRPNLIKTAAINLLLKYEVSLIPAPAYREQLIQSLGLEDDLDNTDSTGLRKKAADLAGESPDSYGRTGGTEQAILWVLAGQIVADCLQPDHTLDEDQVVCPVSSISTQLQAYEHQPFVERPEYSRRFQQLIDRQHRRIVFNGGRGNGKSRLALELVARQPKALEDGIFINASSANTLDAELRSIAVSRGKSPDDPVKVFIEVVSAPDAPSCVILDNLEDPDLLKNLLFSNSRSTIVITANRKIPQYEASSLEVAPMQEPEAVDLVEKLLPTLREQECQRVGKALGYRPLAIVHACGYILCGIVTVDQFLTDLKSNAAAVLRVPGVAGEPTLTAIYALILVQLEQLLHAEYSVRARELLELIACVAPEDIPPDLLREVMGPVDKLKPMMFPEAVLALQTRFLVRVVESRLAIHPLTQEILRTLLREDGKEQALCLRLHQPIQRILKSETKNRPVSPGVIDLIAHICKIVVGLEEINLTVYREINLSHTLAVIFRSVRQMRMRQENLNHALAHAMKFGTEIVASVLADNDSSLDDASEATHDIMVRFYGIGKLTSEEYLNSVAAHLGITNLQELRQYENLEISHLIDFCAAALAHGLCSAVVGILQSQESRVRNCKDTLEYGNYKALQGEAWLIQAAWPQAEDALKLALSLYDDAGNDVLAMRGSARTLKLLGDLAWMSGAGKTPRLELLANSLVRRRQGWEKDVLTKSYLEHFFARQHTAEYLQAYYLWLQ